LFFRGSGTMPFGAQIRSVRDLVERLLGGDAAAEPA
jgi:nitronate monooxygenase